MSRSVSRAHFDFGLSLASSLPSRARCWLTQAEAAAESGQSDSDAESRMSDAQSAGFGDDGELDERPGTPESQRF